MPEKVTRILDGVYHADGGIDDPDFDEEDGWIELGPEDPVKEKSVRSKKVDEARSHGISRKGLEEFRYILSEYADNIKTKLDRGQPSDISPLKVNLKPNPVPVRSRQRRYPPEKRYFMERYPCIY